MKHTIWARFPLNKHLIVSIDGDCIETRTNRLLPTNIDVKGYKVFVMCKYTYLHTNRVQRLVAITFIPNPECKPEVNHKDCNKDNNTVENFDWMTTAENIQHAIANGAREACSVAGWNKSSSILTAKIKELGRLLPRLSNREIGRQLCIDKGTVGKYR